MQRSDTSHHNNMAVALLDGRHGQLRGMKFMLRKDRLGMDTGLPQQTRNERIVIQPAALIGHGIDDDKPLLFGQSHDCYALTGIFSNVRSRKS